MIKQQRFASFDGQSIAYHTLGEGRPTLLLHGFLASAELNWFTPGLAGQISALGRQIIAPDLRGHGASAIFNTDADYPADVLAMDQEALIAHLGLVDFDVVSYSLGARTWVRMLVRGARPAKLVLGGMGDSGATAIGSRMAFFEDAILNGENAAIPAAGQRIQAMMKAQGLSPQSMLKVLKSQIATSAEALESIETNILVVSGIDDNDNGSAEGLAALLANATAKRVGGDHLTAVMDPGLGLAITAFLGRG